jgi:YggT family protein
MYYGGYSMGVVVNTYINPAQKEILVVDVLKRQLLRLLVMYFLVTNVFVFLRMVLRMFGADPQNFFAGFVFLVSGFFLFPFYGIFPQYHDDIIAGKSSIDISAFIALFCSNILIFLAMTIIYISTRMVKTRKQARETLEKSKPVDAGEAERVIN